MLKRLKRIDHKLLPRQSELQYGPYIWLLYLFFFFIGLVQYPALSTNIFYATAGTLLFLVLYFNGYWASAKQVKWNILGILIIGFLLSHLTPGASVFFIYAAAFCCRLSSTKRATIGLFLISACVGITSWYGSLGIYFYMPAIFFTFLVGGVNIYQHDISLKRKELILSQQEVRHLARTSERERIARDLHDLIGHTFSVIALKAELANKLVEKDIGKAKEEIRAIENTSREALSQIREVVSGYRTSDLNTELAHAKYVLESNEISFQYQFDKLEMDEHNNKELAIILKELVTNILKHSQSTQVEARIEEVNKQVCLTVKDDGIGFVENQIRGFGLKGISERVNKLNGKLSIQSSTGTEVTILVPLSKHK